MADDPNKAGRDALSKQRQAREALNAEAAKVMETSRPTPSQEENDLAKLGLLDIDAKEEVDAPEMPSLQEQQQRVAAADPGAALYQTRSAQAQTQARESAAADAGTTDPATGEVRRGPGRPRSQ